MWVPHAISWRAWTAKLRIVGGSRRSAGGSLSPAWEFPVCQPTPDLDSPAPTLGWAKSLKYTSFYRMSPSASVSLESSDSGVEEGDIFLPCAPHLSLVRPTWVYRKYQIWGSLANKKVWREGIANLLPQRKQHPTPRGRGCKSPWKNTPSGSSDVWGTTSRTASLAPCLMSVLSGDAEVLWASFTFSQQSGAFNSGKLVWLWEEQIMFFSFALRSLTCFLKVLCSSFVPFPSELSLLDLNNNLPGDFISFSGQNSVTLFPVFWSPLST